MTETPKGLLLVLTELGSNITEQEATSWFNNEHGPMRLTVPGINSASSYKLLGDTEPKWLTIYDLANLSVLESEEYKGLRSKASDVEKSIFSRMMSLDRRTYVLISGFTKPDITTAMLPGKYVYSVNLQVTEEGEAELEEWYKEEHVIMCSKIPGWLRGCLWKINDSMQLGSCSGRKPCGYLALHDLTVPPEEALASLEYKAAMSTPWREKVVKNIVSIDANSFERQITLRQ